jgi:outer membrane protein insertion porin family
MGQKKIRTPVHKGLFVFVAALAIQSAAWAFDSFTVREIRAQGLQRLEIGTLLTYLPLAVGDELNDATSRQAIRALYQSGLFQDVQLLRDGDALIVKVKERPAIASFSIEGNEKIGGDDLKKSLKDLGLTQGELFKKDLLDQVTEELRRQYFANGYYDVDIDAQVNELPNNRVDVKIKVTEGKVTKIKQINIIGNKAYSTEELVKQFKLQPTTWMPFQKSDRYSKQQLGGDIETLHSYYQDRGFLEFTVASVQIALSPDKKDIYITVNVEEGDRYTVSGRRYSGETVLGQGLLDLLVTTKAGETFSRKDATESANRIEAALADIGYAFAKVTPLTEVDEAKKQVALNYYIEPGKRTYVRHVNFTGNTGTNDETLRREMRQLEAAPFSKSAVERSRVRLQRLPFIEEAEVDTQPVPGTDDQVDVSYKVKERAPGNVQFGVGYSGSQGFLINASVVHSNFLGTGNRVALSADTSAISKAVSLSWTDPYFTEDGISQTLFTTYRKSKSVIRYSSGFDYNIASAGVTYGIPLSEYSSLRLGGSLSQTAITSFPAYSSDQILAFLIHNGDVFNEYEIQTGIARDTRNRTFFASRGALDRLNLDVEVPGSDLTYYNLSFQHQQYFGLPYKFFIEFDGTAGLIDGYGGKSDVPPYQNYFAGGPGTVRGYRDGTLGPRDSPNGNPFGGKVRTTAQTTLVIPTPFETDNKSTRLGAFFDIGDVFAQPEDFRFNELRRSVGVSFQFFTPILGLLDLSYAFPLNAKPGDEVTHFQINFGSPF